MTTPKILAEPGLLYRRDSDITGNWNVFSCEFERGAPKTALADREMHVPSYDHIAARTVRVHEMLHAKLSPINVGPWLARGNAKMRTLVAVEECRINFLVNALGFPANDHMKDGSEGTAGEMVAVNNDWTGAVLGAVSLLNSAGIDAFMRSIKKNKPEWDKPLREIFKKIRKDLKTFHGRGALQSTQMITSDLAPYGFIATESIACWLERILEMGEPGDGQSSDELTEVINESKSFVPTSSWQTQSPLPQECPSWGQLNVDKAEMTRQLPGTMSKTRRASDTGRNPRRIGRALTDPHRRIFDSKRRAPGGVVLIDASGSMRFDEQDIRSIVESCPGALVAMYSEDGDGSHGRPNLRILADKGKFVEEIPHHDSGNNIDFPALQWAVKQRKKASDPVVWVTDGAVTATNGEFYPALLVQCVNFCRANNVLLAENQPEALLLMKQLTSGKKPSRVWPYFVKDEYERMTGIKLSS